jgi:hypothetical protein
MKNTNSFHGRTSYPNYHTLETLLGIAQYIGKAERMGATKIFSMGEASFLGGEPTNLPINLFFRRLSIFY